MPEEVGSIIVPEVVIAESPAPAQSDTASPVAEVVAPVEAEQPAKTFTQEELDAAISKRLAREARKWEREQAKRIAEAVAQSAPKPVDDLKPDQFSTPEAYAEALAERRAIDIIAQRDAQRHQSEAITAYAEREEAAAEKYDDYMQVTRNPSLPITDSMVQVIRESESGPDIAYYLGTNPKEAARIARLSPFLQAKEIGRLEAKLADAPPSAKKITSAPAPIEPVVARSTASVVDTTDPRSIKSMSTSEWIAAERARQIKKLQAQRHH